MKIWTINCTSYEDAKDIKNGHFEDVAPFAVARTRDQAVSKVLESINADLAEMREVEARDNEADGVLPGAFVTQFPDKTADDLMWQDRPTHFNKMRWNYYDEWSELTFVIAEHELTD